MGGRAGEGETERERGVAAVNETTLKKQSDAELHTLSF